MKQNIYFTVQENQNSKKRNSFAMNYKSPDHRGLTALLGETSSPKFSKTSSNWITRTIKGTQDWDFFGFDFEICIISLLVMSKY